MPLTRDRLRTWSWLTLSAACACATQSTNVSPHNAASDSSAVSPAPSSTGAAVNSGEGALSAAPAGSAAAQSGALREHGRVDKVPGPWDIPYPKPFDSKQLAKRLPSVRVVGNHFVDASGTTVVFQGVNISDPHKLDSNGRFERRLFEAIARWGANVVRIPIHPAAWRERGKDAYFALLDQAVLWATELDLYLIIDWHSIGNLINGLYQHPMYETTQAETYAFWRDVSFRYADVPTVAFYELFNEPTVRRGRLGIAPWEKWKAINEELVGIITVHDADAIALVAGFEHGYDLKPIARQPIEKPNVAYVSHPYPMKVKAPFEQNWDTDFGFAAKRYPLFTTEIGYMGPNDPGAHSPAIDDGSYGKRITDYLGAKGASWVAWCFDPDWAPQLIKDWDFTPTPAGATFRDVMLARKAKAASQPRSQ